MIKDTVKNVSLFNTVTRADNDGPNMEHSSKIALNVQAAITWYTRMCKDVKGKVNLAKKKSHLYFRILYNITFMVVCSI